jgi:hypothetical protein
VVVLRVRRLAVGWTALVAAIAVLGLLTSEGEPVCEGPFIWRVDDSLPPQCPSPTELLPVIAIAWLVGLGVLVAISGFARSRAARSPSGR